jgi:hypothetical protein
VQSIWHAVDRNDVDTPSARGQYRPMSNGAYDSKTLQQLFGKVGERIAAIEAQLAILSEKAGVAYQPPSEGVPQEIVDLAHAGNKIEAIKQYRILTGASFEDARNVVGLL